MRFVAGASFTARRISSHIARVLGRRATSFCSGSKMSRLLRTPGVDLNGQIAKLDTYPVLIFKSSRGVFHHGAVGIARTLGRLGVPVYAIVEDALTPLAHSRYVAKAFVWDEWPSTDEQFLGAMSTIAGAIGRPAILIPLDDLSAITVAENAATLRRWFLFPELPSELPRQLADKGSLFSLCRLHGVPCAEISSPCSDDDLREFTERTSFPVIAKAARQWQLINNRYSCIAVPNQEVLSKLYANVRCEDRSRIILQEYIPGDDWIYHAFADAKNDLFVSFTGKKLLSSPPATGSTALGLSHHNETLRRQSESFLKAISYSGIIDMDWRLDAQSGQYKIVDCNPRVGQNFRMFETESAVDVVRAQYLNLLGARIERGDMIEKRLFTVESLCLPLLLSRRDAAIIVALTPGAGRELAWWCRDDPMPLLLMGIRKLDRVLYRMCQQVLNLCRKRLTCPDSSDQG